jgi:hypothetical protein
VLLAAAVQSVDAGIPRAAIDSRGGLSNAQLARSEPGATRVREGAQNGRAGVGRADPGPAEHGVGSSPGQAPRAQDSAGFEPRRAARSQAGHLAAAGHADLGALGAELQIASASLLAVGSVSAAPRALDLQARRGPPLAGRASRAALAPAASGPREEPEPGPSASRRVWPSESARSAAEGALARGLDYLAKAQARQADGSLPLDGSTPATRAPVAVTALAALAWMADGSQPDRGPFSREVGRAIDYLLLRTVLERGAPRRGFIGSDADSNSRMHGHGYATLALTQACSLSPASPRGARLFEALPLAVDLIQRTQGSEGGWWYEPEIEVQHEGSVTITLVQALRAARGAGFEVRDEVIARAEDYVRRSQAPDGKFRYQIGSETTSLALTAAAVSCLQATGRYDDPAVTAGLEAIWRELIGGGRVPARYPFYERMYLSQALWHARDGEAFGRYLELELADLLGSQQADGSWGGSEFGLAYATAMNCLLLALPAENLPIFHR